MRRFKIIPILLLLAGLTLAALTLAGSAADTVLAAAPAQNLRADTGADNADCLTCHGKKNKFLKLGGEKLLISVDGAAFDKSIHGTEQVACTDCHTDISDYPHPDYKMGSVRELKNSLYEATQSACKKCHTEETDKTLQGIHQQKLGADNYNAAVCSDCHSPHEQERITNKETGKILITARLHIPQTCAKCHSTIYDTYKNSVHGDALTQRGNLNVPTCIDCHGVHNIQDPTTAQFRNNIPLMCAKCHANGTLMRAYGLSTDILNTYVADFHGTTVTIFEKTSPDQPTNKPVCSDCHGVHNITKVDNAEAGVALRENLLVKCQRCHPDATANFSDAWMSHYEPSPEHNPLVYYVNLFYKFFIPAVLGGMIFFILTDIYRRIVNRAKGVKHS